MPYPNRLKTAVSVLAFAAVWLPHAVTAQTSSTTADQVEVAEPEEDTSGLLTAEDLETLVAPVALYPDTLLIQVLVASTYPLDVIKADQFIQDSTEADPDALQADIEEKGWDESVAVLASAFPDVLSDMADHIDWTETIGTAMLAQDQDVMDAVQVMRAEAEEAGNLESGEQQTVEVTQEDNGDQTIIIQPTDPQVVYVPQYDTQRVYVEDTNNSSDVLTTAAVAFGSAILINEIFDDDDYWGGSYWGCRNCGGWGGGPIIRSPNIDLDVDGNVNIGNRVGDIGGDRNNIAWKPDDARKKSAQDKLSKRRDGDGRARLPDRQPNRGDQMRNNLSNRTGAADISRSGNREALSNIERPNRDGARLPDRNKSAIDRTKKRPVAAGKARDAVKRPEKKVAAKKPAAAKAKAKAAAKKPVAKPRKAAAKKAVRKPSKASKSAIKKRASSPKARAGAKRGKASRARKRR